MINNLLFLGIALTLGFLIGKITHNLKITAIVGFIVTGILLGPVIGVIDLGHKAIDLVEGITLGMVAFIIGEGFTFTFLKKLGKTIAIIVIVESLLVFFLVTLGVYLYTQDPVLALIFGSLAPATAPAGTIAAIREYKAKGKLTDVIVAIV